MARRNELEGGARLVERIGQLVVLDRLVASPSTGDVTRLLVGSDGVLGFGHSSVGAGWDAALAQHVAQQVGRLLQSLAGRVGPVLLDLSPSRRPFVETDADVRRQPGVRVVAS